MHPGLFTTIDIIHEFVKEVLWEQSNAEILRMKGIIGISGSRNKYILQSVREMYDVIETEDEISDVDVWENKFVLIGRGLDRDWVIKKLEDSIRKHEM